MIAWTVVRIGEGYEATKARARRLIEQRLRDEKGASVGLSAVRQLCHRAGLDAFVTPVLADMEIEGLVTVWKADGKGMIYFEPKWAVGGKD